MFIFVRRGGLVAQAVRRSPPTAALGSRVRVSVTPCGFRGGRNGVWVGFSWGFSRFPLPEISFHHFSTLISSISFHFIRPCDGASGVIDRHPCYSQIFNKGGFIVSHFSSRPCAGHLTSRHTTRKISKIKQEIEPGTRE